MVFWCINVFIFDDAPFICLCSWYLKGHCLVQGCKDWLLFSSMSFTILVLAFRFLIYFEMTSVYGVRQEFNFTLFVWGYPVVPNHLWKGPFFPFLSWFPFQQLNIKCRGLFSNPQIYSTDVCLSLCQCHTVLTTIALQCFEIGPVKSSNFFFPKIFWATQSLLWDDFGSPTLYLHLTQKRYMEILTLSISECDFI